VAAGPGAVKTEMTSTEKKNGAESEELEPKRRLRAAAKKPFGRDYAEAILIAVVVAFVLRAFVVQAFKIPSGSMKRTLLVGDYVVVEKVSYRFRAPGRGDVVVFKYPHQDNEMTVGKWFCETYELIVHRRRVPRRDYVKRVIGVPGDVVLGKGTYVYVNGQPLREPYLYEAASYEFGPFKVPPDAYFVMGDDRAESRDSRYWGFVPRDLIKGRAALVYWSWCPDYCPKHRAHVSRLYRTRLAGTEGGEEPTRPEYICDAGGEILVDGEDVRLTKWYEFWRHVRWGRVLSAVE
jgi:signal peptidase I